MAGSVTAYNANAKSSGIPVSAGRELEQSLDNGNRLDLTSHESLLGHGL